MKKVYFLFVLLVAVFSFVLASCDSSVPEHTHEYGELIPAVAATCEEDGIIAHYHCESCDKYFDENKNEITDLAIKALGHKYSNLIAEVPATCEHEGVKAHYTCESCDKYFDENKNEITDLVIPAINAHKYILVAEKEATLNEFGVKAHYECEYGCDHLFLKENDEYVEVSQEALQTPKVAPLKVAMVDSTMTETGIKEHYVYNDVNYLLIDGVYVEASDADLIVPLKGYNNGTIEINESSILNFDLKNLTTDFILSNIRLDVEAEDGKIYVLNPTEIVDFTPVPGRNRVYTFKYTRNGETLFTKDISLDLYHAKYVLADKNTVLKDGDRILISNVFGRVMVNTLTYAGYASGSNGAKQAKVIGEALPSGLYPALDVSELDDAIIFTLKESSTNPGAFHLINPFNGLYLCGGMGYTQWIPSTQTGDLQAASMELIIGNETDDYSTVIHGLKFVYSYLRCWNRYANDEHAFFITNTATYGDNTYIYVLEKDYTGCAHEYTELLERIEPTCEKDGQIAHYGCLQCDHVFDENKNEIPTAIIKALGHDYQLVEAIPATPDHSGVVEHYECSRCHVLFVLENGEYIKKTIEELTTDQLNAEYFDAKEPNFEEGGWVAYCLYNDGVNDHYYIQVEGKYVEKSAEEIFLPKKELGTGDITIDPEAKLVYYNYGLTEAYILENITFVVPATDGTNVLVHANSIEGFDEFELGSITHNFIYSINGTPLFTKEVTYTVKQEIYELVTDYSTLKDNDIIILVNANSRAMADVISYVGYAKGSQGSTKIVTYGEEVLNGMKRYAVNNNNDSLLQLTLFGSEAVDGAFYLTNKYGNSLCGGMGYTQWVLRENEPEAAAFTISALANGSATLHGNKFNYSYLRIWNRYGKDLDAFFITNSATYGDDIYIYRLIDSASHKHLYEHHEAVSATCEHAGNIEYYYCPSCDHYFDAEYNLVDDVTLPIIDHDYSELIVALDPTCTEKGYIAHYECTVCHKYFDEDKNPVESIEIEALDHSYYDLHKAVAAKCNVEGSIAYYECERCHHYFDEDKNPVETIVIEPKGHNYSELIKGHAATCTEVGAIDHYECLDCGMHFDNNKEVITNAYIEMHNYVNGACSVCGHAKPLSVVEAKQVTDPSLIFTVRGVVVGWTGNYDGGYVWVLIKDLTSNEVIGVRKSTASENDDGKERVFGRGYSYAPTCPFLLGDIIEIPVSFKYNTATKGGETSKPLLFYRGESFTDESTKELVQRYRQGHVDYYRLNLEETTLVIDSQEKLESFVLSSMPQWKLVCIKGTKEAPLKFVTHSATTAGVGNIAREYIYLFYDNPTSLNEQRVNGAAPVFSNFGNQFNLINNLSTILCGQKEYTEWDWANPYEFVGEIYCMINGGSTAYYQFMVFNQNDIVNRGYTEQIPVGGKLAYTRFYTYQAENAKGLGIEVAKTPTSAVGVTGVVNVEDMVKIGIAAVQNPALAQIWSKDEYTTTYIDADGNLKEITVYNAATTLDQCKKWITSNYKILGSKCGWLNYTSETRPYYVCNTLVAVEGPEENTAMVGYVYNKRADNGDDSVYYYLNILYQILLAKRLGQDTTALEAQLNCDQCAGVIIPLDGSAVDGYDYFGENSKFINFSMNGKELITTASSWKAFTGLTCCRYFTEEQLDMKIEVLSTDLNSIDSTPSFKGGEIITLRDALHFMMLPSSNICPAVIARIIGSDLIYKTI